MKNISYGMHVALELVRDGMAPRLAAVQAEVSLQGLYRAMRREKVGARCSQCGRILPAHQAPPDAA